MRPRYLFASAEMFGGLPDWMIKTILRDLPHIQRQGDATLFTAIDTPIIEMPAIDGWIIGNLFSRDGRTPCNSVGGPTQLAMARSRGRHLIEQYSGSYVAIFRGDRDRSASVLRSPSAAVTAFWHRGDRRSILCSDPHLLWAAGLASSQLDWESLAHYLRFPLLPTARTCIETLIEILPGQWVDLDHGIDTRQVWAPNAFAMNEVAPCAAVHARNIGDAIDAATAGFVAGHGHVGIELSGGLDSSIVASAITQAGVDWTALNLVPAAADGDERFHAAAVAKQFGGSVVELAFGAGLMDMLASVTRPTARPGGVSFLRGIDRLLASAGDRLKLPMILGGGGGDNVFCALRSTAPIADGWRAGGVTLALAAWRDVATITQATHWDVTRHFVRRVGRDAIRPWRWPANDAFLHKDVRPRPDLHPWLDLPRSVPIGTRAHIAAILRAHPVLDAHDRIAEGRLQSPLLSQPVMEACLAVPSWRWIERGRDRAVARAAFEGRLPNSVLRREGKARLDTLIVQAYDRDRRRLRDLLCDGLLCASGLLDRAAIATYLERPVEGADHAYPRILDLADAELWAAAIQGGHPIARS